MAPPLARPARTSVFTTLKCASPPLLTPPRTLPCLMSWIRLRVTPRDPHRFLKQFAEHQGLTDDGAQVIG
jgi:hypothetical protein